MGSEGGEKLVFMLLLDVAQMMVCLDYLANEEKDLLLCVCVEEKGLH